jgi:DNA-binding NtrC family response regulator
VSSCHSIEEVKILKSNELGRILFADDEEVFLRATTELLRDEGYRCDCARDVQEALARLRRRRYDLLITDIKMPGNPNLELIREVQQLAANLPVIVVTGYPSLESAIHSVHLPVVAYLVKPLDYKEFINAVRRGVEQSKAYQAICRVQSGLKTWSQEIGRIKQLLQQPAKHSHPQLIEAFVAGTLKNVAESLLELQSLTGAMAKHPVAPEQQQWVCQLARTATMVDLIRETVEVLERTKSAFKSKSLGEVRHKLQVVLDQWENDSQFNDR